MNNKDYLSDKTVFFVRNEDIKDVPVWSKKQRNKFRKFFQEGILILNKEDIKKLNKEFKKGKWQSSKSGGL